jgi:hypothetical protein
MALYAAHGAYASMAYGLPMFTLGLAGTLILINRPGHLVGHVLGSGGSILALAAFLDAYARYSTFERRLPLDEWAIWSTRWIFFPGYLVILLGLFHLFPTGLLPSSRWKPIVVLAIVGFGTFLFGIAASPSAIEFENDRTIANPAGMQLVGDLAPVLSPFVVLLVVGSLLAAIGSLLNRTIRARGVERQQIKWLASASVVAILAQFSAEIMRSNDAVPVALSTLVSDVAYLAFVVGVPAAIVIAILRHDLYEIDRLINRTVVYVVLTVCLVGVYLGLILGLGSVVRAMVGESSSLVTAASTLAVAALFRPLRTRIQRFVNRRFYRGPYDAARTVESFSARLRDEVDLATLTAELHSVVTETLQPAHVSLWLLPSGRQTT